MQGIVAVPTVARTRGRVLHSAAMPRHFHHTVRVPYAHVDKMGFVYYAHHFVYYEMARAEMLRAVGLPYTELEARGVMLPVVEAHCNYHAAARFDDALDIDLVCTALRGARLCIEYRMTRDDTLITTGHTHHVCMSPDGKPMRPIPELRRLVEEEETNDA